MSNSLARQYPDLVSTWQGALAGSLLCQSTIGHSILLQAYKAFFVKSDLYHGLNTHVVGVGHALDYLLKLTVIAAGGGVAVGTSEKTAEGEVVDLKEQPKVDAAQMKASIKDRKPCDCSHNGYGPGLGKSLLRIPQSEPAVHHAHGLVNGPDGHSDDDRQKAEGSRAAPVRPGQLEDLN
ncbi:uncharacterized protein LTR77_004527 [Saxophila tyrrhenica]|uniref:Uncharacterized protein n=1 Tax=Saxophila tyrrhenica TaxID=1690608 RepID=A0AAV9PGY1_9PEZI|nr:hypothetical protein LTR77_004527 [Saxophila tyrrhenica]